MSNMWSDAPIKSIQHDSFGRVNYAEQIASLINSAGSSNESIVFGLTGPWGSGKSSMLAMVEESLGKEVNSWQIAKFTPWATSDINGLFTDFHASLSEALPSDSSDKLQKSLGTLLRVTAPITKFIPVAGGSVETALQLAADTLQKQPSWNRIFKDVSDSLRTQEIRILVVTDDIDRLHGDELLALLKVVRLLGRFPGVHFLLAYDEETVAETIAQSGIAKDNDTGRRFMEKIVQYPLSIPPLTPTQLLDRLDHGLSKYVKHFQEPDHFNIRINALKAPLLSVLSTPRAIDRFLAQLDHTLAMFDPYEVELGDVVILTLLKVSFSSVFNKLPRFKHQLISGMRNGKKRGSPQQDHEVFSLDALLHGVPTANIDDAKAFMQELFPVFREGESRFWMQPNEKSISKPEYFDRYFVMGVPDYDIADTVVTNAVNASLSGDGSQLEELLTAGGNERICQVVEKAEIYSLKLDADESIIQVLRTIFLPLRTLPRDSNSFFSPVNRIRSWGALLLSRLSDNADPSEVKSAFASITNHEDQIEIIRILLARVERKPWIEEAMQLINQKAVEILMDNLRLQDEAPCDFDMWYYIKVLWDWGELDLIKEAIQTGLTNKDFTKFDVAARCVERGFGSIGEPTKLPLAKFSTQLFDSILPDTLIPHLDALPEDFDIYDLSWENRRTFAMSPQHSTDELI